MVECAGAGFRGLSEIANELGLVGADSREPLQVLEQESST